MIAASLLWLAVATEVASAQAGAGAAAPGEPTVAVAVVGVDHVSVGVQSPAQAPTSPSQIALCVASLVDVGTRRALIGVWGVRLLVEIGVEG